MQQVGVVVGRFQVSGLHAGHRCLLDTVLAKYGASNMLVLLGCSPRPSKRNPLDFITRKLMLHEWNPNVTVLPLMDQPDDELWNNTVEQTVQSVFPFGQPVLYGGKNSFLRNYTGSCRTSFVVEQTSDSGTERRQRAAESAMGGWEFRRGVIYGALNRFNQISMCVDVAIIQDGALVLLGKRGTDKGYRFPGGHVDVSDKSLEHAAIREAVEETGLQFNGCRYITSMPIADYRNSPDNQTFSAFFHLEYLSGAPRVNDELVSFQWVNPLTFSMDDIERPHKPLFASLVTYVRGNLVK